MSDKIHICTIESELVNGTEMMTKCSICLHKTKHLVYWTGIKCTLCGTFYDFFELYSGQVSKRRRDLMGFTRRQLADKTGYSIKTIKKYEFTNPSKVYFKLIEEMIHKYFKKIKRQNKNKMINLDNILEKEGSSDFAKKLINNYGWFK